MNIKEREARAKPIINTKDCAWGTPTSTPIFVSEEITFSTNNYILPPLFYYKLTDSAL